MDQMRLIRWGTLAIVVLLSACSLGQTGDRTPTGGQNVSTGVGPGISIYEALASTSDEPLLINGWLVISPQGEVRFCSALGESNPPSCAGSTLAVTGLDPNNAGKLADVGGVQWSEESVQLLGTIKDGRLVVSATSL